MAVLRFVRSRVIGVVAVVLLLADLSLASGISCYKCSSKNGSDINCDDPFHPAHSKFEDDCHVPKERHIGQFPANFCVKIVGTSAVTGESLMIRTCVLENMDSQCGVFKFGGEQLTGCILTCTYDGCNSAPRGSHPRILLILTPVAFLIHLLR
ncbi:uncharacterized protein [Procambarus clarkii]|uniref:uncharacterized protein n=1 Tax=Procambarus clarkii TaxID=6728 RepID=UPI001E67129E|nr:uncharacterized protein LOC123753973 [Procambarus clarkii]